MAAARADLEAQVAHGDRKNGDAAQDEDVSAAVQDEVVRQRQVIAGLVRLT